MHKPSGLDQDDYHSQVNNSMLRELNDVNPEHACRLEMMQKMQSSGGLIDYSSHPYVLGDAISNEDIIFEKVNDIGYHTSGLSLVAINASDIRQAVKQTVLPKQYNLIMELGKATDNSFCTGKVLEKSTYSHLKGRPQLLEKVLSMIRSNHQKEAFRQAGVSLQSQEAYEMAVSGVVLPTKEHPGYTLIYSIECLLFKPPIVNLRVTCVNETPIYLAELVAEIGLRLRTNAVLNSLQLIKYGPFTSENSLLPKHANLQNIIDNVNVNHELIEWLKKKHSWQDLYEIEE